jgi:hypothetical protein
MEQHHPSCKDVNELKEELSQRCEQLGTDSQTKQDLEELLTRTRNRSFLENSQQQSISSTSSHSATFDSCNKALSETFYDIQSQMVCFYTTNKQTHTHTHTCIHMHTYTHTHTLTHICTLTYVFSYNIHIYYIREQSLVAS